MKKKIYILILFIFNFSNAQQLESFKTPGSYDQYVPVVFNFNNKPFSISRPNIHENRQWLAYGITTINGIGYGWGSGNTMLKVENFTSGFKNTYSEKKQYSYIGKVLIDWTSYNIIVFLRGNTTYYTDGKLAQNIGVYDPSDGPIRNLKAVNIEQKSFNLPRGIYVAEWEINSETPPINHFYNNKSNVGIGTENPDEKLTVKGKIHAEEVIVDLNVPADYVFQKYYTGKSDLKADYVFPKLNEIETFVKENNHLPDMPSAKEIQENGLKIGEMNNLLLQKIEELTLLLIEQDKTNQEQQKQLIILKQEINQLKQK